MTRRSPREVFTGLAILLPVFGALLWLTFGLHWQDVRQLRRESAIWADGVAAPESSVEGEEHVHYIIETLGLVQAYTYDFTVRWIDAAGGAHEHPLHVESIVRGIDRTKAPIVRSDPASPEEFALSWAIDLGWARWAWTAFLESLGTLVAILVLLCLKSAWKQLRPEPDPMDDYRVRDMSATDR